MDDITLKALADLRHTLANVATVNSATIELAERTNRLASHLKAALQAARDEINQALLLLPVLALLVLCGCAPSWRSQALVDAQRSPLVGEWEAATWRPGLLIFPAPDPRRLAQIRARQAIPQPPYTLACWDITITGEFW